jgi:hypothetical protein
VDLRADLLRELVVSEGVEQVGYIGSNPAALLLDLLSDRLRALGNGIKPTLKPPSRKFSAR